MSKQSESSRARKKPGRKKGDGGRNSPEKNPTPLQRGQQEQAFYLSLEGKSVRTIASELSMRPATVASYIRIEERRRSDELGERREMQTARSVQTYEMIKKRALKKSDVLDSILIQVDAGGLDAKVNDHSLDAALKAQERIDKVLGVDAPSKTDVRLQRLEESLREADDPDKPLS